MLRFQTSSRSTLLVSLAVLRALAIECRRDIRLLSVPLMSCIDTTLSTIPEDLEVVARAASVVRTLACLLVVTSVSRLASLQRGRHIPTAILLVSMKPLRKPMNPFFFTLQTSVIVTLKIKKYGIGENFVR